MGWNATPVSGPRIYNLFPLLAGPIARWSDHLERIARMRFDWVYVNPFHETGFSGSLYAVRDYARLDARLIAESDASEALGGEAADALVRGFVDTAEASGQHVMMDLVVNHTSKDALFVETHPDWYARDDRGEMRSPFAIDPGDPARRTVWGDLAELDWSQRHAREAMLDAFGTIVGRYAALGVRGFRCDAAYKVPADVWRRLIEVARGLVPTALFAAETLGATPAQVEQLAAAGFDYLFNSSKWWDFRADWLLEQYEAFRHIAPSIAFPESHDTVRLASELEGSSSDELAAHYRFRYLFAATFSAGVMMPMGYEYGFAKALDVVATRPEDWEMPRFDIIDFIAAVNSLKARIEPLNEEGPQERLNPPDAWPLTLLRHSLRGDRRVLSLFNPSRRELAFDTSVIAAAFESADFLDLTPLRGPLATNGDGEAFLQPLEARVFVSDDPLVARGDAARSGPTNAGRVAIEHVAPSLDAGRYAVKRTLGETFAVEADVFLDGHDEPAAVVKFRERGTSAWTEQRMEPIGNDRRRATIPLPRIGTYEYVVEGWVDAFASWQNDVRKKRDAAQPLALEFVEGRALLGDAVDRARGKERA
ncbi:MAG: maltotransferase domain-containing protein, partial [Candidatus Baltobacteraceae bacterium]